MNLLEGQVKLAPLEVAILSTLAQHRQGRTKEQIALLTGYSVSGHFKNVIGGLRTKGYITKSEPIFITDDGLAAIEGQWEPLPTGPELREMWKAKQGKKGIGALGGKILDALAEVYPDSMPTEKLAEVTGYSVSGHFKNVLGRLRSLELVSKGEPRLADELTG